MDEEALKVHRKLSVIWVEDGCAAAVRSSMNYPAAIIPAGQKRVGDELLMDLRNLKDVTIPEGIQEIGEQWFKHSEIESVAIPASVRSIGKDAFCGCKKLQSVAFAEDS